MCYNARKEINKCHLIEASERKKEMPLKSAQKCEIKDWHFVSVKIIFDLFVFIQPSLILFDIVSAGIGTHFLLLLSEQSSYLHSI